MKIGRFLKWTAAAGAAVTAASVIKEQLEKPEGKKILYDAANTAANGLCAGIAGILPDIDRPDILDFTHETLLPGSNRFASAIPENAAWSLGYSDSSILPEDVTADSYYIGGYLAFPPNRADRVLDDQKIRCIALSDGEKTAVFAVIDCVGISNHDINDMRTRLLEFCRENKIVSLNISATHSHSCIDTMGVWGELTTALKTNPVKILKEETDFVSGRNEAFMENLKVTAVTVVKEAVENLRQGKLYHGIQDGSRFVRDKRPPEVMMSEINSFVFVPDDGSAATRAVMMAAHPTQFGGKNTMVSSDYPYYLCEEIEKNGEHAIFFQGAQLAIATERGGNVPEGLNRTESIQEYGRALGRFCREAELTEIAPLLNITHRKILIPVTNRIFSLLAKIQVINNDILRADDSKALMIATELGYCELGGEVKMALLPGEIAPELVRGGCFAPEESYDGSSWVYPSLEEISGGRLIVIGLCNDEIGYVIPDNDFGSLIAPLHYEESVSTGKHTASKLVKEYREMIDEIQREA